MAYIACSSVGDDFRTVADAMLDAGVIVERSVAHTARIGHTHFWFFTRWLYRVSIDARGVIVASKRLQQER